MDNRQTHALKTYHYVFPQLVTRVYEKNIVKAVHIVDKGGPNQHEEIETERLGWVMVIGTQGYLMEEQPPFQVGEEVEVVIRPRRYEKRDA